MNEQQFYDLVYESVRAHPEWTAIATIALTAGTLARLREEQVLRSNAEVALSIAYEAGKTKLSAQHRPLVEQALAHTATFAGTPYEARLRERME